MNRRETVSQNPADKILRSLGSALGTHQSGQMIPRQTPAGQSSDDNSHTPRCSDAHPTVHGSSSSHAYPVPIRPHQAAVVAPDVPVNSTTQNSRAEWATWSSHSPSPSTHSRASATPHADCPAAVPPGASPDPSHPPRRSVPPVGDSKT